MCKKTRARAKTLKSVQRIYSRLACRGSRLLVNVLTNRKLAIQNFIKWHFVAIFINLHAFFIRERERKNIRKDFIRGLACAATHFKQFGRLRVTYVIPPAYNFATSAWGALGTQKVTSIFKSRGYALTFGFLQS